MNPTYTYSDLGNGHFQKTTTYPPLVQTVTIADNGDGTSTITTMRDSSSEQISVSDIQTQIDALIVELQAAAQGGTKEATTALNAIFASLQS